MAAFCLFAWKLRQSNFLAKNSSGLPNLWLFSAKPENIEEELLQLKIPAVAKFNAKTNVFSFSFRTYQSLSSSG